MKKAIIGKKVGMTQIFDEAGKVIPVTVIEAGPNVVVQKMTKEKEGYDISFEQVDASWTGCWWDVIYFTFGKKENLH